MAAVRDLSQLPMSYEHHDPHHIALPSEECFEQIPFEVSDYLLVEEGQWEVEGKQSVGSIVAPQQEVLYSEIDSGSSNSFCLGRQIASRTLTIDAEAKRAKTEHGKRIGFRTKSMVEILDDGYKWRKYGKKSVKNSPNPRNYYKCNTKGCNVKKRVERDREDPSYVLTIYEGTHSHACPTALYCCNYDDPPPSWSSLGVHSGP